ncbi:MAG: hypothetical protein AAF557_10640 [Pseudomonadota bacterium]
MQIRFTLIALTLSAIAACAPAPKAPPKAIDAASYQKQDFGFNGCEGLSWSAQRKNVSLEAMRAWAASENAPGFAIHPRGLFGQLLTAPLPEDCRSKATLSWPLYLAG